MKRAGTILLGSLAANIAFVAAFELKPTLAATGVRNFFRSRAAIEADAIAARAQAQHAAETAQKQAALRAAAAQAQVWSALQTDDLHALVARLRAAGFPATVVRAIVSEIVQARFTTRIKALTASVEDTPFWQASPRYAWNNPRYFAERSQIYRDRARLLRELLGDDFFATAGGDPTSEQRRQFGNLSKSKIDAIRRINDDYAEMISQVRVAAGGITLAEDRERLALLEREKRADLAALLPPQELEEYNMRSSAVALRLRTPMTLMDATEEEFRTLFRINQAMNDRLFPAGGAISPELMQQRREATKERDEQIKQALGEARAAEFIRASNYEFRSLATIAQNENLPLTSAIRAFDLRNAASEEANRISKDKTLSYPQQMAAMQSLAQTTRAQLNATLGPIGGPAYTKSATWLQALEKGTVVTFTGDGSTTYRTISKPEDPSK